MEVVKRMRLNHRQQLDVPDLIQRIQLLLPSKDAASTCILSKSWLHAWSTSPAIRFCPSVDSLKKENQITHMKWIRLTLLRYHRENLPITSLDLQLGIHTTCRAAKKLIKQATSSKSSLKELHLAILAAVSFTLPDEIFSSENLSTLRLELISPYESRSLRISSNPAIQCTNLRVLELSQVHISQDVLDELISKNKLLEKIILDLPKGFGAIEINNLRYLRELEIYLSDFLHLEIDDVPSLRSLVYGAPTLVYGISGLSDTPAIFAMCTMRSLRELQLDNVYMDDEFSDMINSNFPFLEELVLVIKCCTVEILDFTCLTLQKLRLYFALDEEIKVQVYAQNLLTYEHISSAVPSLLFTTTPPKQIQLSLTMDIRIDESYFLKIRETLKLSSKFNILLDGSGIGDLVPFNIDDYVRTMVPFPATNVEKLFLRSPEDSWENVSLFFDAVFSICHPMYVKVDYEGRITVANYFLHLIIDGVMKICEIRDPLDDGRWVTLTSSSLSLLDRTTTPCDGSMYEFKLSWCSP